MTKYTKPSFDELVFAFDEIAKFKENEMLKDNNQAVLLPSTYIISAFQSYQKYSIDAINRNVDELPDYIREHFQTVNRNVLALANVQPSDYNKAGFDKVISSLQRDGKRHFKMSVFFASLIKRNCEDDPYELFFPNGKDGFSNIFDNTTSEFNCTSVACIAGFAVAEASDWRIRSLYRDIDLSESYVILNLAANYLNIPLTVADSIFYGGDHSVWSWLKNQNYYDFTFAESNELSLVVKDHINKFESIIFDDDFFTYQDYDGEEQNAWEHCGVELDTITWKEAVELLTLVRDEVIVFNRKFSGKVLGSVPYWNPEKMSELQGSK